MRFYDENKYDSSWFASTRYVATCRTKVRYIATCQTSKSSSLCSRLNPDKNAFRFVSIGVSVEILRRKQIRLVLTPMLAPTRAYLHFCVLLQISIKTSLVSSRLELPLKLYDKKKKPQRLVFSHELKLIV